MHARVTANGEAEWRTTGFALLLGATLLAGLAAGCGGDPCAGIVCGEGEVCVDGACVPDGADPGACATDADCAGLVNRTHCLPSERRCVQCTVAAHCPDPGAQVCVSGEWICRARPPCAGDADCTDLPATPWCAVAAGECVACLEDAHCPGGQQVCVEGQCRFDPCDSDADCAGVVGAPWCSPLTGECLACLADDDCEGEDRCVDGVCRPPGECEGDADCPPGQVCDTRRAVPACAPCGRSDDCRLGGICWSGECGSAFSCGSDADCGPQERCGASGACVGCLTDADCAAGQPCVAGLCERPEVCGQQAMCWDRQACEAGSCTQAPCTADAFEPNDAPYAAAVLPEGPVDATLCPNEWDWYVLRADPADGLVVDLAYASPDGNVPDLRVWAGDGDGPVPLGAPVATDEGLRVSVTTLSWRPPYWIGVRGVNASMAYRLEVEVRPGGLCDDDDREPDDSPETAPLVTAREDATTALEGRACAGDDDWLRVRVPGGRRLFATLEGEPGVTIRAFVPGSDGAPMAVTGEGVAVDAPLVETETVHWLRVRSGTGGAYALGLRLKPPRPEGDLCSALPVLAVGGTVEATTEGAVDHGASACGGEGAADVAFGFTLPATARVDAATEGLDAVLSLRAVCDDAATEAACADRPGTREAVAAVLPAGDWVLWVDGYGDREGPFTASLAASPPGTPPPENGCAAPPVLDAAAGGGVATADLGAALDTLAAGCGLPGADAAWRLDLASEASLSARLEAPAGASLSLRGACDDGASERACTVALEGDPDAAELFVPRVPAGRWTLVADGVPVDDGAIRLTWALGSPVPEPANDDCASPTPLALAAGAAVASGDTRTAGDDRTPGCARGGGADVVYTLDLAAPAAVTARLDADFDAVLALQETCGGGTERACSDAVPPELFEPALPAGTWHLWVDAFEGGAGPFELTVETAAPRPVPVNDACLDATLLAADGGPVSGSTWRAADDLDPGPACTGSPAPGPDVFHRLELVAGQTVEVTATPAAGYDLALYLLDGCTSAACLSGSDASFVSGAETVTWTAPATGPVFLGVDAWAADEAGDYSIEVRTVE